MLTYKTCNLDDEYRHVTKKDLDLYISKDDFIDYLRGCSDIEIHLIKGLLGLSDDRPIDHYLDDKSNNAVENSAISEALSKKADKTKLSKVAITGDYYHLKNIPNSLSNPHVLVIKDQNNKPFVYDGSKDTLILLPLSITDFADYKNYLINIEDIEDMIPIKHIKVNGLEIEPNENKTVLINIITKDDIWSILKNYPTKSTVKNDIDAVKDMFELYTTKLDFSTLQNLVKALNESFDISAITDIELNTIILKAEAKL